MAGYRTRFRRNKFTKRRYRKRYMNKKRSRITSLKVSHLSRQTIVPDRAMTAITYYDTGHSGWSNAGAGNANLRYRPTSAFDIDPHIASAAIAGYSEWAGFYKFYRVHAFKYDIVFSNTESTIPILAYVIPLHGDPGDNIAVATAELWQGNAFCKSVLLSTKGGMDRGRLVGYMKCNKFVGSKTFNYDDSYASAVNTNPTNNIWLAVGALSTNGGSFTAAGFALQVRITLYVEFYERQSLTS